MVKVQGWQKLRRRKTMQDLDGLHEVLSAFFAAKNDRRCKRVNEAVAAGGADIYKLFLPEMQCEEVLP